MLSSLIAFIKKNKLMIFVCLIVTLVIVFVWRDIPQMIMRGDGFVYLVKRTQLQYWDPPESLANFDQGATLVATLFTSLFGANISMYYWTEIVFMVAIGLSLFLFIYVVSGNILLAFITSLFFSVNYFSNFNMYAYGAYSFFLERIVNVAGIILSLTYLHLFLTKNKWKYYWISIIFYFVSVGLAHWFVLFTPAFVIYPISWYLFSKKSRKLWAKTVWVSVSYALLSGFFILIQQINQSGLGPKKWGFIEFLLNPGQFDYPEKIIRQLVYWSGYVPYNYLPDAKSAIVIAPYIVILYLLVNVLCYLFIDKEKRYLIFWSFWSSIAIFYLNSYFGQYDMLNQFGANRYLYLPGLLLSVFWSVVIWWIFFKKRKLVLSFLGFILMVLYILINSSLINHHLSLVFQWDKQTKILFNYIVSNNAKYQTGTMVVTPYNEVNWYETEFFNDYLGKGRVNYVHEQDPKLTEFTKTAKNVYRIKYNSDCDCVRETKVR